MGYDVKKLHKMENALNITAGLVGKSKSSPNDDGVKEGLDLSNESLICLNAAEAIKEGVFKVIVMGIFKNGKSSIINALIGSRILPEAATPATAIISYIRYGADDNNIYVYNNDGSVQKMSPEAFFEKYKFSLEDATECKRTGRVERFSKVNYSVVYCDMPILKNGVQILDSPGLEDKECATKVTLKAASNANAIIYTGAVPSGGFNINDCDFFKSNFEGRHLNNVFFLLNKSDLDEEEELQEVKDYFKEQLHDVFKDEKGIFNEELFSKRVFFISARNVLEKKTGIYTKKFDDRDIPEFNRFEKELEGFLTTDARSIATFNSCFAKIANAYQAAVHTSELNDAALQRGVESVKEDVAHAETLLDQSENELKALKKSFDIAITKTQSIVEKNLTSIVDNINDTWNVEMNRIIEASGFSELDLMKIAGQAVFYIANKDKRDAAFSKIVAPITDGVQSLIRSKIEEASSNINVTIRPIMKDLAKEINQTQLKLDNKFSEIYKIFTLGDGKVEKGNVNIFKLIGAFGNGDANVMIEVLAGNDMGWADFLKTSLTEMFIDTLLFSIIGGPVGFALFVIKEWWALRKGKTKMLAGLAAKSKDELIRDLKYKIEEKSSEMSSKITDEYNNEFTRISKDVRASIAEERKLLEDTKKKLNNAQFDYFAEVKRCKYITDKIQSVATEAYSYVFGKDITKDDLAKLSVSIK